LVYIGYIETNVEVTDMNGALYIAALVEKEPDVNVKKISAIIGRNIIKFLRI
jgi:hypothetical protein